MNRAHTVSKELAAKNDKDVIKDDYDHEINRASTGLPKLELASIMSLKGT